jgi:hypothetical protein
MLMHSKYEFVVYTHRELDEEYISQLDNQKAFAKKRRSKCEFLVGLIFKRVNCAIGPSVNWLPN